jgi:hypothetical protein
VPRHEEVVETTFPVMPPSNLVESLPHDGGTLSGNHHGSTTFTPVETAIFLLIPSGGNGNNNNNNNEGMVVVFFSSWSQRRDSHVGLFLGSSPRKDSKIQPPILFDVLLVPDGTDSSRIGV